MRVRTVLIAAGAVVLLPAVSSGQALSPATRGPVIEDFGPVFRIESPDFPTPRGQVLRAVFDVSESAAEPDQLNRRLESAARFLNMHGQAGVPASDLRVALVVHGTAGKDLLDHEGYRRRHGGDNPNLALIAALVEAGAEVVLCGQTQVSRGLDRSELASGVKVALSAMTALVALQENGFRLVAM